MRKTDRRTLYTEQAIKDTLLQCCKSTSYRDVTITDVCRTAEINRGTFYRHYRNLPEVLDEILDDVTDQLADLDEQWEGAKATESCGIPLCQFIRQETKYRPLFLDEALCPALLRELEKTFPRNAEHLAGSSLSEEEMAALNCFQLNGCLSVVRSSLHQSDPAWNRTKCVLDQFIQNGYESFQR